MNEYGGFRVARTLPKYVEDQVKCMRTDPWPGVHAAAVINNKFTSNFVELKDGIISRSLTLPEIKENTIHKIEVLPSELGWFYVLFSEETVFLISGQKFQLEKTFENVLYSGIQNFMGDPCRPLLFIEHSNGESILTDGYKNYDLKQTWPPNQNKSVVQETLSKRLKIASNHAEDGEHKLRVLKNLVQDSVRSLAASYSWNSSFQEDEIGSLFHPSRITEENQENDYIIQERFLI